MIQYPTRIDKYIEHETFQKFMSQAGEYLSEYLTLLESLGHSLERAPVRKMGDIEEILRLINLYLNKTFAA
jgi:hypothetical protein